MKKIITFLCFFLSMYTASAQSQNEIALLQKIDAAINDTARIREIRDSLGNLREINPILDMKIYQKLLSHAQKIKDRKGEALFLSQLGYDYRLLGNTTKSLEYFLIATVIAEETGDEAVIAETKINLGHHYKDQADYTKAIKLYLTVEKTRAELKDYIGQSWALMNLGQVYLYMNKIDTALMYSQRAYELCMRNKNYDYLTGILRDLGSIQGKMGNSSLAVSYFDLSIKEAKRINSSRMLNFSYSGLAQYYYDTNQHDSSLVYAKKAISVVHNTAFANSSLQPAKLLLDIYRNSNIDSAFKYSEMYRVTNDSLFSTKIIQQTQLLSFEDEIRQQELASEKIKAEVQRKHNLQFAAITIGLITFIILFFVLSRSIIVKTKFIEFFGILGLLALFEFINLLIHPYLAHITHDSPVLMLGVLIAIGALLIPLHHKLEKWITKIMVEKNKKIRLDAAKKTIAILEPN